MQLESIKELPTRREFNQYRKQITDFVTTQCREVEGRLGAEYASLAARVAALEEAQAHDGAGGTCEDLYKGF
jgi:hypothetical protein